ncbi:Uncharacterized protein FWK35_00024712 [Aphis craccivora]|uniref:Uncharacterized protein n=1 Tax=Aphis craccivora TaxID=307492 RepID=A0A6G0ZGX5_APHCR|nr:Uncharacterized protein FWK35_00024712 [Aphis craccivora]
MIYTKNYSIWDPGGNPALSSDVGGSGDSGASGTTQTCIDRSCEFRHSSNHQNAQVFAHLRLFGYLAINFKCTSFECNTLYAPPLRSRNFLPMTCCD